MKLTGRDRINANILNILNFFFLVEHRILPYYKAILPSSLKVSWETVPGKHTCDGFFFFSSTLISESPINHDTGEASHQAMLITYIQHTE